MLTRATTEPARHHQVEAGARIIFRRAITAVAGKEPPVGLPMHELVARARAAGADVEGAATAWLVPAGRRDDAADRLRRTAQRELALELWASEMGRGS